jgi:hypothetical protein
MKFIKSDPIGFCFSRKKSVCACSAMEDAKLLALYDSLKSGQPKGKSGLGVGGRITTIESDLPKNSLYARFVRAGSWNPNAVEVAKDYTGKKMKLGDENDEEVEDTTESTEEKKPKKSKKEKKEKKEKRSRDVESDKEEEQIQEAPEPSIDSFLFHLKSVSQNDEDEEVLVKKSKKAKKEKH